MNILLLGKIGQLGWELQRALAPLGRLAAVDYPEIDLTKPDTLLPVLRETRPRLIVNATAYTAVDRAESETDLANAINAQAPGLIAEEAQRLGAALIHYSTDYVFDGTKGSDYVESDIPNPLNVYGQSKLDGERTVEAVGGTYLILRTAWVYSMRRESFVSKVLQWARQQETLRIVSDQVSNPTWARILAEITALLIARAGSDPVDWLRERRGVYHLAGDGRASRLEWAQEILRYDQAKTEQTVRQLLPASTAEFPSPAQRPLHSALSCERFNNTFGLMMPNWKLALRFAMDAGA
jgi:dTDP-4-dehydrorhamnose reductase